MKCANFFSRLDEDNPLYMVDIYILFIHTLKKLVLNINEAVIYVFDVDPNNCILF